MDNNVIDRPPHNGLNFGLAPEDQVKHLGSVGYVDFTGLFRFWSGQPQWLNFSPLCEIQRGYQDDYMDCTCEGKVNAVHIFEEVNGDQVKESVRFLAKNSGVTRNGNTVEKVTNSLNSDGLVNESDWPRDPGMSWDEYYASIPDNIEALGKKWTEKYTLKTFAPPRSPQDMMKCLQYGILGATGYAWAKGEDGLYHDYGYNPNHYFIIVGYVEGKYWIVYDSYPTDFIIDNNSTQQEFEKHLAWDFDFGLVELLVLQPKNTEIKKKISLTTLLKKSMKDFYYYWDGKHNFFRVGVPAGENKRFRQAIHWDEMTTETRMLYLGLRDAMNQSSWAEVSKYPDITTIGKKFA